MPTFLKSGLILILLVTALPAFGGSKKESNLEFMTPPPLLSYSELMSLREKDRRIYLEAVQKALVMAAEISESERNGFFAQLNENPGLHRNSFYNLLFTPAFAAFNENCVTKIQVGGALYCVMHTPADGKCTGETRTVYDPDSRDNHAYCMDKKIFDEAKKRDSNLGSKPGESAKKPTKSVDELAREIDTTTGDLDKGGQCKTSIFAKPKPGSKSTPGHCIYAGTLMDRKDSSKPCEHPQEYPLPAKDPKGNPTADPNGNNDSPRVAKCDGNLVLCYPPFFGVAEKSGNNKYKGICVTPSAHATRDCKAKYDKLIKNVNVNQASQDFLSKIKPDSYNETASKVTDVCTHPDTKQKICKECHTIAEQLRTANKEALAKLPNGSAPLPSSRPTDFSR